MPDDIILAKAEIIERCLVRIESIQAERPGSLTEDLLKHRLPDLQAFAQQSLQEPEPNP